MSPCVRSVSNSSEAGFSQSLRWRCSPDDMAHRVRSLDLFSVVVNAAVVLTICRHDQAKANVCARFVSNLLRDHANGKTD